MTRPDERRARQVRRLRLPRPLRAADLPARADGGLRHRRAALPLLRQPLQRHAAGLDRRAARHRHDLRHPDRRHRPLDRLAARLRRARRGGGRRRAACRTASPSARGRSARLRLVSRRARGDRRRPARRLHPGLCDHAAEGAALRGHARRHVGVPRRGAALRRRRPDQRLRPRLRLVGAGAARPFPGSAVRAGPGDHLPRLRRARPYRAALHALRAEGLCGRRQSGGGAALRPERPRASRSASTSSWASSPGSAPSCSRRG